MSKEIYNGSLHVGQWIYFTAQEEKLSEASEKQQSLYDENRFFLVISRHDDMFDGCRCFIVDMDGNNHDYCPRMHRIGYVDRIWGDKVMLVDQEYVESIHGISEVQKVYQAAKFHLGNRREYFAEIRPTELLDVDGLLTEVQDNSKSGSVIRKR